MDKETAKARLRQVLREFDAPNEPFDEWEETPKSRKLDAARFPVIELIYYGLVCLMNYPHTGHEEKVRWTIYGMFRGKPFALQLAKFGPRLRLHDTTTTSSVDALLVKLGAVVSIAERCLASEAADQIEKANVSIGNNFGYLSFAYEHLRKLAKTAYRRRFMRGERQGSVLAGAMIDAFFSRLEHFLVLSLPFVKVPCDKGALQTFIGAKWSNKFKTIFDCANDINALQVFEDLKDIKDRVRNVLAHGAMEKEHGSLWVHIPALGAIPAQMTRIREKLRFQLFTPPLVSTDFTQICNRLDSAETFFRTGRCRHAWQWVTAGLDVAYDAQSVGELESAMRSNEDFAALLDRKALAWERHVNMDY